MPRPNSETMEAGGYPSSQHPYGRPQQQQQQQGGAASHGGTDLRGNTNAGGGGMGLAPQGYDGAVGMEMRQRYGMAPHMSHHPHHHPAMTGAGGLVPGMDHPSAGLAAMGGPPYHHQHQRGHHDGMGVSQSPGGGGGMMNAMSQHQHHPAGNYYPQEMSPNMQRMTAGSMYMQQQGQAGGGAGNSPSFTGGRGGEVPSGMIEMGSESARGGSSSITGQGGMPGAAGAGGSNAQADREEELLLNLLIARRQRGRITGEPGGGRQEGYYADELLRLRQGRAAAAAAAHQGMGGQGSAGNPRGAGGTLPPMPGMPPLYMDPVNTLPTVSAYSANGGHYQQQQQQQYARFMSDTTAAMNVPAAAAYSQDGIDQRIDRPASHLMDARSQDMMMMRDFSGRGIKRSPYDMGVPHGHNMPSMKYHMQVQGLDLSAPPPSGGKKKRSHKKKPADMPRRPLSAYNLFFSEERERILKEIDGGGDKDDSSKKEEKEEEKAVAEEEDESKKPKALLRPLIPNQKKRRPHRKTHGKISFQELARMVGERWKALDDERRKYYQNLAAEDMKRQKHAMEEYYSKQQAIKEGRKLPMDYANNNNNGPPQPMQPHHPSENSHVAEGIPEQHQT